MRPIFYQFTPHLHSDDSSTDVSSCSGSDLSCLHDGDDERSESDLGGHHRNEENEGVGEDCEGLDGEVTEGNENLVHVMMNEMRDDEGDESEAPQRRFPQLMGPQGIHQRQVAIPTSAGVLSADRPLPVMPTPGSGDSNVQRHLELLAEYVRVHATQFQGDLELLQGALTQHDQHLRVVDGLRNALASSTNSMQERWNSLEHWAAGLQQTMSGLSQERSMLCSMLHSVQQQCEQLYQHSNWLVGEMQTAQGMANTLHGGQETLKEKVALLQAGMAFMREQLDGVLIAQASLSMQVGRWQESLADHGELQDEVGGMHELLGRWIPVWESEMERRERLDARMLRLEEVVATLQSGEATLWKTMQTLPKTQVLPENLENLHSKVSKMEAALHKLQEAQEAIAVSSSMSPVAQPPPKILKDVADLQATVSSLADMMHVVEGRVHGQAQQMPHLNEVMMRVEQCKDEAVEETGRLLSQFQREFKVAIDSLSAYSGGGGRLMEPTLFPPHSLSPTTQPPPMTSKVSPPTIPPAESVQIAELMAQVAQLKLELAKRDAESSSETSRETSVPSLQPVPQHKANSSGFVPPNTTRAQTGFERPPSLVDPTLSHLARSQVTKGGLVEPDLAVHMMTGEPVGFVPPPPSISASYCDHHVQMVETMPGGIAGGYVHPLLMGVQSQRPSLVQKYQGGWTTFAKKWEQHMHVLLACNRGNPIPDMLLLQYLKQCLDASDQLLLENLLERNPRLPFQEFWDHLSTLYDCDTQAQQKLAWERVRLPKGELTLDKWLSFLREFHLRRDRVEERTPQEEYKLLLRNLPEVWQRRVIEEEGRRARTTWLVRMTGIPSKPPRVLQGLIEDALTVTVDQVDILPSGALIHCHSPQLQTRVMGLSGYSLEGHVVKCSKVDFALTGDQLVDYITQKLQAEQRLQNLRSTFEPSMVSSDVHLVEKGASVSGGPKGGRSPPSSPRPDQGKTQGKSKGRNWSRKGARGSEKEDGDRGGNGKGSSGERLRGQQNSGKGKQGPPSPQPRSTSPTTTNSKPHCGYCASHGRDAGHLQSNCHQWLEAQKLLNGEYCLACHRGGRNYMHPWGRCQNSYSAPAKPAPTVSSTTPQYRRPWQGSSYSPQGQPQSSPAKASVPPQQGKGGTAPPVYLGSPPHSPRKGGGK